MTVTETINTLFPVVNFLVLLQKSSFSVVAFKTDFSQGSVATQLTEVC